MEISRTKNMTLIYSNILKYLESRGNPVKKKLSPDELLSSLIQNFHVIIESGDKVVMLTLPEGKYSVLNAESKKKIKELINTKRFKEIMFVCNIDFSDSNNTTVQKETQLVNVSKYIREDIRKNYGKNIWVQIRPYSVFKFNVPEVSEIPKHKVADVEEVKKIMDTFHLTIKNIPQIYEHDPGAVWAGARDEMFVEISRPSKNVLQIPFIRLCKLI